jgi:hypothetical protein
MTYKHIKTILKPTLLLLLLTSSFSCNKDWLEREPENLLTDDQLWTNPQLILSTLADFYSRLPKHTGFEGPYGCGAGEGYCGWKDYASYDEAMWSGVSNFDYEFRNSLIDYPFRRWTLWNYDLIRDINLAIDNIQAANSPRMTDVIKAQFVAELRYLRAYNYFELVKRMGGVPIITQQMIYDFEGDPSYLQQPRNTEEEVYLFIESELNEIMSGLGNEDSKTRANRYTALALKSRAMLYAGSLAKYNSLMSVPVTLPNGIVGIPAAKSGYFFASSLAASEEIIKSGAYQLFDNNPDKGQNFYEALVSKANNQEVIMAIDYAIGQGRRHLFTLENIPRGLRKDVENVSGSSALSPSLNLVESFEYLDGSSGALKGVGTGSNTASGQTNWIFYDKTSDIFANKDPRLYGTIIYPGSSFAGQALQMQAGVYVWNPAANKYDRQEGGLNTQYTDGGVLTGADGPLHNENYVSATGFYLRKYLDSAPGAATSAVRSDIWWVQFRLGEIYLNAGEAAFELGKTGEAVTYINRIRERAGFGANSLTILTTERIRNERKVELAFEDHRVWDLRRWRIAHELWDGTTGNPDANIYALFPYRIIRPGHPNHGKYVFDKFRSSRNTRPRHFRDGNYYSEIAQSVINNNPKIVRNPFH